MKKLRDFFRDRIKIGITRADDNEIMEVELWKVEDEDINSDEERAWEIIKEIHQDVLFDDNNWHFFYENFYNIIRCSKRFYPKLIKKLKKLDIKYEEKGEWIDGSITVERYKPIYQELFHSFTMLALREYNCHDIDTIYDRISHCFFNHQFYVLEQLRNAFGRQWESHLMGRAAIYRAEHTGILLKNGVDASMSNKPKEEEEMMEEGVE